MRRTMSSQAQNVHWFLSSFTDSDPFVEQAIVVSADGLLMTMSADLDRAAADRLAAVVTGLRSLADGGGRVMGKGRVNQVIVEMDLGYLFVSATADGSAVAVVTDRRADLAAVGYEMTLLVERIGSLLTPEIVVELRQGLDG